MQNLSSDICQQMEYTHWLWTVTRCTEKPDLHRTDVKGSADSDGYCKLHLLGCNAMQHIVCVLINMTQGYVWRIFLQR